MKNKLIQKIVYKVRVYVIRTFIVMAIMDGIGWSAYAGYSWAKASIMPQVSFAEVKVPISQMPDIPILDKIADCESKNNQTKDGQTLIHVNSDGSYDQGRYQVNSIWNKKASSMGYNLSNEADNKAFAEYLFLNYGSSPWNSSSKCWSK